MRVNLDYHNNYCTFEVGKYIVEAQSTRYTRVIFMYGEKRIILF